MKKPIITFICMMLSVRLFTVDAKAQFMLGFKEELSLSGSGGCMTGSAVEIGKHMKMASVQADFGYIASAIRCDMSLLLRMYGNTDHRVNVYLGAGVFGGMNLINNDSEGLTLGAFPAIQTETFISKKLALYADVRIPYQLVSDSGWKPVRYSLGLRFLFDLEDEYE